MKKFLVSLVIASSALVATAPAAAQYRDDRPRYDDRYDRGDRGDRFDRGDYRGQDLQPRLNRISAQISRGIDRGAITPREGQILRGEMNRIWAQARQFYRTGGGYDRREQAVLDQRIDRLQDRLRFERRDDDRRWR